MHATKSQVYVPLAKEMGWQDHPNLNMNDIPFQDYSSYQLFQLIEVTVHMLLGNHIFFGSLHLLAKDNHYHVAVLLLFSADLTVIVAVPGLLAHNMPELETVTTLLLLELHINR